MYPFHFLSRLGGVVLCATCLILAPPGPEARAAPPSDSIRVRTADAGMYLLTYDALTRAGVPAGADTSRFTMTYLGLPVSIRVKDDDGRFSTEDEILFYAEPYRGRYMTSNVYFFHDTGEATPERIGQRSVAGTDDEPVLATITRTLHVEHDDAYFSDYPLPATADHFFDSPTLAVDATTPVRSLRYGLDLKDAVPEGSLVVRAQFYGGRAQEANPDQSVEVRLNDRSLGRFAWDGRTGYRSEAAASASWLAPDGNEATIETALAQLPGLTDYHAYVDWIEVDYPAAAIAQGDGLAIDGLDAPPSGATVQIEARGFESREVEVYDIRDARRPVQLAATESKADGDGYKVVFRDVPTAGALPLRYYLTASAGLFLPASVEPTGMPSWNTPDNHFDYIAILHPSLASTVEPLLSHRAAEGLRVARVDVQDVYDLFSHGRVDPEAIRSFISYAYHHWNAGGARPRYVLLVGDGHHDFKNATGTGLLNLIPPYLAHVDPWIGETAADNRYACVDGPDDFVPDLALGRIPAQTPEEVTALVDKILAYEDAGRAPSGAWQNRVTFIADQADDPAGNFQAMSEEVRLGWLPAAADSRHLYWETDYHSAYPGAGTPDMNTAIKQAFADSVMVQWFGHASRFRWGSTQVFSNFSIPSMPASTQWPLSVDYTCWSGYFTNLYDFYGDTRSLAEALVLTPGRGSVAAIAPSGLHVGGPLLTLNQGLIEAIFQDGVHIVGDALLAAKRTFHGRSAGSYDVLDTTLLFGDPAMPLRLPQAAPNPPYISITGGEGSVKLDWLHPDSTVTQYQTWRGDNPYFDPATGEGALVGSYSFPAGVYGEYAEFAFTDDGAEGCFVITGGDPLCQPEATPAVVLGDPQHNYVWLVRSGNATNEFAESNRVGEFDFALFRGE